MSTKSPCDPGDPPIDIEERNAWFAALPAELKRVAIAKDVIEQLNIGKYRATPRVYFTISSYRIDGWYWFLEDPEKFGRLGRLSNPQTLIESDQVSCDLCARGGIFASYCRLDGTVEQPGIAYRSFMDAERGSSRETFPNYAWLEYLFELGDQFNVIDYDGSAKLCQAKMKACDTWINMNRDKTAKERMEILMQNLIDNCGELILYGVEI